MLSALLQSYVEEVFKEAVRRKFPQLANDDQTFERYWKQMKGWGNPSDTNIKNLFLKLGVPDIFDDLHWQKAPSEYIQRRLKQLNEIRNQIAHGSSVILFERERYNLTLKKVAGFRNFADAFGTRFSNHVTDLIP